MCITDCPLISIGVINRTICFINIRNDDSTSRANWGFQTDQHIALITVNIGGEVTFFPRDSGKGFNHTEIVITA